MQAASELGTRGLLAAALSGMGQRAGYVAINHDATRQSLSRLHQQAQVGPGIQEVGRTQYASSTQSLSIARCHWVSLRIQDRQDDLTDTEPGLQSALDPPSVSLKTASAGGRLRSPLQI